MAQQGAQLTAEQQVIIDLQRGPEATRQQVLQVPQAHDALRGAHDALNQAARIALQDKGNKIKESEDKLRNVIFRQQFDLLGAKELKPDVFKGRATEAFKPWSRKLKAFCNSKRTGFRAALEWAEKQ